MESSTAVFDTSPTGNNPSSPLLTLPFELRIKIYKELLYPDPVPEGILYAENRDHPSEEHEADGEEDKNADYHEEIVHPENAEGEDEEVVESSEQQEVEVENEDDHGDDGHDEVSADGTNLNGEGQNNGEATARLEKGDYARIDYGSTPPDYGFGWLQPSDSCGIDPSILRVNKQIPNEGVSLLYKNVFCCFRFDQDLRCWSIQRYLMQEYRRSYAIDGDSSSRRVDCVTLCTRRYNSRSDNRSGLNMHCLRWVPDINISISWDDILEQQIRLWESDRQNDLELHLTPGGQLILDILRYLNQTSAPSSSTRGRLHMTLNGVRWVLLRHNLRIPMRQHGRRDLGL